MGSICAQASRPFYTQMAQRDARAAMRARRARAAGGSEPHRSREFAPWHCLAIYGAREKSLLDVAGGARAPEMRKHSPPTTNLLVGELRETLYILTICSGARAV